MFSKRLTAQSQTALLGMAQNMFRSGFLVRATHTLITWAITLTLFLHNTGKLVYMWSKPNSVVKSELKHLKLQILVYFRVRTSV